MVCLVFKLHENYFEIYRIFGGSVGVAVLGD